MVGDVASCLRQTLPSLAFSIRMCPCCKEQFPVYALGSSFGKSCYLSALTNTAPLWIKAPPLVKKWSLFGLCSHGLSSCHGSSSPPTLGWNQRRENLTIVSRQQSLQELLQKHVQLAWLAAIVSFPRVLLPLSAGEDGYRHGSQEKSEKE